MDSETAKETVAAKMDLQAMERALDAVLSRYGLTDAAPEMLQDLATADPHLFFAAGVARLRLEGGSPGHRKRSLRLLDTPAFLLELVRSELFSAQELKSLCGKYIREDSLLDVKLARLMPGRRSDVYHLGTDSILRILDVLDEISPGPRLLMIIGHLTHYSEQHVASKAALLVGRRLQNREWVERHLASTDPRIRASVAEALWNTNSALAARTFRKCLCDENNRVHGNALVGLHLLGDRTTGLRIRQLTKDSRPGFRQTAAWVIGKVEDPELVPLLEGLLLDPDQGVRQSAANALEKLRGTALNDVESDTNRSAKIDSVPATPQRETSQSEPVAAGELAATTPEVLQPATPEVPDPPGQTTAALAGQRPNVVELNIHLDGRYVTGD